MARQRDPLQMVTVVLLIAQSTIQSKQIVRPTLDRLAGRRTCLLTEWIPILTTNPTMINAARRAVELQTLANGEPLDVNVL